MSSARSPLNDVALRDAYDLKSVIFTFSSLFLLTICLCYFWYYVTLNRRNNSRRQTRDDIESGQQITFREVSWIACKVETTGEAIANSSNCVICLKGFEDGDVCSVRPKCSHTYHKTCIEKWLTVDESCPLCRGCTGRQSKITNTPDQNEALARQVNIYMAHRFIHPFSY